MVMSRSSARVQVKVQYGWVPRSRSVEMASGFGEFETSLTEGMSLISIFPGDLSLSTLLPLHHAALDGSKAPMPPANMVLSDLIPFPIPLEQPLP